MNQPVPPRPAAPPNARRQPQVTVDVKYETFYDDTPISVFINVKGKTPEAVLEALTDATSRAAAQLGTFRSGATR